MRKLLLSVLLVASVLAIATTKAKDAEPIRVGEPQHWTSQGREFRGKMTKTANGYPDCDPTVTQYSGYFNIDQAKDVNYFYWFFGARHGKMSEAPLLLWLSGGPGCSSELSITLENGPCKVDPDGVRLHNNPYAWNEVANVLFVDQPAGVGFSYGDRSGYDHNETQVGIDMYNFLQAFFKFYPEFQGRKFFIYGESYGGHYAPASGAQVVRSNKNLKAGDVHIDLVGVSTGNGWVVPEIQYQYDAELAYNWCRRVKGEPCVSEESYNKMRAAIPTCLDFMRDCNQGGNLSACVAGRAFCGRTQEGAYAETGLNFYDIRLKQIGEIGYNISNVLKFLNSEKLQSTVGAKKGIKWSGCSNVVFDDFTYDPSRSFDGDVAFLLENNVRFLAYAGDMDFICNWLGNRAWTLNMDWSQKVAYNAAGDKPWYVDDVPAGNYRSVPGGNMNVKMTFLQIHGAGHQVPWNQPVRALKMVQHFINDVPFTVHL